jgi:hypothetical protein
MNGSKISLGIVDKILNILTILQSKIESANSLLIWAMKGERPLTGKNH